MIKNADMTIYNVTVAKDGVEYQRTSLYGVSWQGVIKSIVSKEGLVSADVTKVFIPFDITVDKAYKDPVAYQSADKDKIFTLAKGDLIVRGVVDDEIHSPTDLQVLKAAHEVLTVTGVATHDNGGPKVRHWELEARA